MTERPILFSAPMVRAILDGRKTQTRRLAHLPPQVAIQIGDGPIEPIMTPSRWAEVKPGNTLWVREAHYLTDDGHEQYAVYAEDVESVKAHLSQIAEQERRFPHLAIWPRHRKLRPSIHMPRWASRITLEVTAVRVERLQDISEEDAKAEGAPPWTGALQSYRAGFYNIWNSINGSGSWEANPLVAVISFRRIQA